MTRLQLNKKWQEARHYEKVISRTVAIEFPSVKSITILWNNGNILSESPNKWDVEPSERFNFYIGCGYRECVEGGFDLTEIVRHSIKQKETQAGTIRCCGWEDMERYKRFRCDNTIYYSISAEFE